MVSFTRRRHGAREQVTVRAVGSAAGGARVVVGYPDGLHRVHYFADDAATREGTVALQAELTAAGWEPVRPPVRGRPGRRAGAG